MNALLFPAGDDWIRHRMATHRLLDAPPPRRWSVEVNRQRVQPGDTAYLWQTGDADDVWRPGIWAVGVVLQYTGKEEPHWRDKGVMTAYADVELQWTRVIDRDYIRTELAALGEGGVLASRQFRLRSPTLLKPHEEAWLMSQLSSGDRDAIACLSARVGASGPSAARSRQGRSSRGPGAKP